MQTVSKSTTLRISDTLDARLDALAAKLVLAGPPLSRSEVLRYVLDQGVTAIERNLSRKASK